MKIYKNAKIIEEVVNGRIELYPLTKDGKKSKRRSGNWSFEAEKSIVISASTLINCSKAREEVYESFINSISWNNLGILARNFPNAVFVFEHSLSEDYINICENRRGTLKFRSIFMNFIVVDGLIISKAESDAIYYPVEILPISIGKSYEGNKVYVDAAAHEAILLEEKKYESGIEFGGVFKKMYCIDTRTAEIKNVRKFFDGVEL